MRIIILSLCILLSSCFRDASGQLGSKKLYAHQKGNYGPIIYFEREVGVVDGLRRRPQYDLEFE